MELPPVLISALRESIQTVVLTGSGISAESGVPTFREAQTGLWARFDPQELATPEAFARDPGLVWDWYAWRRKLVAEARPNPGHLAIAEMQRLVPNLTLVTQNVDGLHRRAGSSDVIELHGNISRTTCSVEGTTVESYNEVRSPPPCPSCGAPLRPDVVWFGEELPVGSLEEASEAARGADLFLPVGTSSLVYPAAALPFEALEGGATLVEVNPADTCSRRMRTMRCADRRAMFCRVRSGNFRSSPFYVRRVGSSYSSDVREREEHCLCR